MVKCFNCGEYGHKSSECTGAPNPDAKPTGNRDYSGQQSDRTCYNCNKTGHISRDCLDRIPNKESKNSSIIFYSLIELIPR